MGRDARLGERLRQVRLHRNISQGRLAKAISVTVGTIQNYERGRVVVSVDRIEQLARALQCEPTDLLRPSGSPPPRYRHRIRAEMSAEYLPQRLVPIEPDDSC
jgi:transcriptional regulator with XRE-family HTH domain